jgi:hypothetical protein
MPREITAVTLKRISLPLPGGRLLHVALVYDVDGNAEDLVLAAGFPGSSGLRELAEGLSVPASSLPALRDSLEQLERA